MRSNLTSHVNVTKTPQKHILWTFWGVLMIIKSDLKIDLMISEPYYVKFFYFVNLLHRLGVWHFDIWQIISLMFDLMSVQSLGWLRADFGLISGKFGLTLGNVWASSGKVWAKFGQVQADFGGLTSGKVWTDFGQSSGWLRASLG